MRVTVDLILFVLFGAAFLVACAVMIRQIVVEATMARRFAREDEARDAAVAVRLEADEHWAGVESEWRRYLNDFAPTMGHDPERLGGAS